MYFFLHKLSKIQLNISGKIHVLYVELQIKQL